MNAPTEREVTARVGTSDVEAVRVVPLVRIEIRGREEEHHERALVDRNVAERQWAPRDP